MHNGSAPRARAKYSFFRKQGWRRSFFFRKTGPETIKIDQIKRARGGLVVGLSSCERGVDQCAHCCRVGLSSNSGSMTHILWYILDCLEKKCWVFLGIPSTWLRPWVHVTWKCSDPFCLFLLLLFPFALFHRACLIPGARTF